MLRIAFDRRGILITEKCGQTCVVHILIGVDRSKTETEMIIYLI